MIYNLNKKINESKQKNLILLKIENIFKLQTLYNL